MTEFRILELFSGIGGMHLAFQHAMLPGKVVSAMDINTVANGVYAYNHPNTPVLNNNIQRLSVKQVNEMGVNMVLMSPPCQPFTRVGNQRDVDDNRTDALKHLCKMLPQCAGVEYVLMENVKGFETSRARDFFVDKLKSGGFFLQEFILSPTQFGVPNTRHRYYCLARRNKKFDFENGGIIWKAMPPYVQQITKEVYPIKQIIQHDNHVSNDMYLDEKVLRKRVWLMDIVGPESYNSICFTKAYTHYSEGTGSIFTTSSEKQVKETFEQIKHFSDECGKNLESLQSLRLRYFTPCEVARLMSFPDSFSFPKETSTKQKYRLLGNSINILVVGELLKLLCSLN